MWPVLSLHSKAKSELEDVVSRLWRLNILGDAVFYKEGPLLKKDVILQLRKAGIRDPKLEVTFERNKKFVAAEARFTATAEFGIINKKYTFNLTPKAVTKAEAVDW
jgi:hypothetical protein